MFHSQLTLLSKIFQENGYPENFIDRCFEMFLNRTHILKEKVLRVVPKNYLKYLKSLRLVLPYLDLPYYIIVNYD